MWEDFAPKNWLFHHDNASFFTKEVLTKNNVTVVSVHSTRWEFSVSPIKDTAISTQLRRLRQNRRRCWELSQNKTSRTTNSVAFSPQANYTDWATATGRRILVASCGQRGGTPTASHISRPEPPLLFQVVPHLSSRGWVDPVPNPLLLRKSDSAGNWTQNFWVCSQEL
jgi:hypothetical protein